MLATNSSKHSGLGLNLIIDSFCIISPIQVDSSFVVIERVIDHPMRQNAGLAPIGRVERFFCASDILLAHLVLPIAVCFLGSAHLISGGRLRQRSLIRIHVFGNVGKKWGRQVSFAGIS